MVDFCLRYHRCSIKELLDKFDNDLSTQRLPIFDRTLHEGRVIEESKLVIKDVRPIYSYPLKNYLHERSIPVAVADLFCKEVGYRIGDVAYTPDVGAIPDSSFDALADLDVWIVDALRWTTHPSHSHVAQTLDWIARARPRTAILTNMHIDLDYNAIAAKLPANVFPAFDGLTVTRPAP